jgi:hypothetical protein
LEELASLAAGASEEVRTKEKLATLPMGAVVAVEESSLLFALWTTISRFIRRVIYCGRIAMAVPYLPYGKQRILPAAEEGWQCVRDHDLFEIYAM